jgi:hypothetical protein
MVLLKILAPRASEKQANALVQYGIIKRDSDDALH